MLGREARERELGCGRGEDSPLPSRRDRAWADRLRVTRDNAALCPIRMAATGWPVNPRSGYARPRESECAIVTAVVGQPRSGISGGLGGTPCCGASIGQGQRHPCHAFVDGPRRHRRSCVVSTGSPGTSLAWAACMTLAKLVLLFAGVVATGCSSSDSVWDSSVSKLVLAQGGGFAPPSQPTADCPHAGSEYTLLVANRMLSAWRCTPGPQSPYPLMKDSMSRTLPRRNLRPWSPSWRRSKW